MTGLEAIDRHQEPLLSANQLALHLEVPVEDLTEVIADVHLFLGVPFRGGEAVLMNRVTAMTVLHLHTYRDGYTQSFGSESVFKCFNAAVRSIGEDLDYIVGSPESWPDGEANFRRVTTAVPWSRGYGRANRNGFMIGPMAFDVLTDNCARYYSVDRAIAHGIIEEGQRSSLLFSLTVLSQRLELPVVMINSVYGVMIRAYPIEALSEYAASGRIDVDPSLLSDMVLLTEEEHDALPKLPAYL